MPKLVNRYPAYCNFKPLNRAGPAPREDLLDAGPVQFAAKPPRVR